MKRFIFKLMSILLIGTSTVGVRDVKARTKVPHTRTEFAICYDVSVKDNMTYIATGDGNCYMFECDDSDVGDVYKVTFDTKGTKSVKDDAIIGIKYINTIDDVSNIFDKNYVKR